MKTFSVYCIALLVIVVLYFIISRSQFDNYDGRIGIQYSYGDNEMLNTTIDTMNGAIDELMKNQVCKNSQAMITTGVDRLPPTCTLVINSLPQNYRNDKIFSEDFRSMFCNKDDTVNKTAFKKFLTDMNTAVCQY